jgi:hypothetical protein
MVAEAVAFSAPGARTGFCGTVPPPAAITTPVPPDPPVPVCAGKPTRLDSADDGGGVPAEETIIDETGMTELEPPP